MAFLRKLFLSIIIVLGFLGAKAQKYNFEHYSIEEGLIQSQIQALFSDSKGYIWVGTHGGVSKFDGVSFTNFNRENGLPDEYGLCFTETKNDKILVGTRKGIAEINKNNEVKVVAKKNGEPVSQVWTMISLGDSVLIASSTGLLVYDKDGLRDMVVPPFLINRNSRSFTGGGDYPVYVYSAPSIFKYENGTWDSIPEGDLSVISLAVTDLGKLFIGNWVMNRVLKIGNETRKSYDDIIQSPVTDIYIDDKNQAWISTWDAGIYKINGSNITNFSVKNGLPSNSYWGITQDNEGNYWFGSFGGGLIKFKDDPFTHFDRSTGIPDNVVNYIHPINKSSFLMGTDNGIIKGIVEGDYINWVKEDWMNLLDGKKITEIVTRRNGELLIGCYDFKFRLVSYNPINSETKVYYTNVPAPAFSILEARNGEIFIGTDNKGLFHITEDSSQVYFIRNGGNRIVDLAEDEKGQIWMATLGFGVNVKIEDSIYVCNPDELKGQNITSCIPIDNDKVWLSSESKGMYLVHLDEGKNLVFDDSINTSNGLLSNVIQSIHLDAEKNMWVSTNRGLVALGKNGSKDIIKTYSKSEGFVHTECLFGSLTDINGRIYVGTSKGLSVLNTTKPIRMSPISRLELVDVKLRFESKYKDLASFVKSRTFDFPYNQNHLSFSFRAVQLTHPEKVQYRYYLEGLDKMWSPYSKSNEITYSSIPPGKYTLKIESKLEGQNDSVTTKIEVIISPPFWKTKWFYSLAILSLIGLIILIYKLRMRKIKMENEKLEKTVKIRTAELVEQKEIVEEKNSEIMDSIAYAKRIQSAILPPLKLVKEYLDNSFILYKPKDVVAGDFYWMEHKDGKILFAAADCTGHGVPGAMVSVICNNGLNRSVREHNLTDPGKILDKTREIVIEEFSKSEEEVKDGMDIALCTLEGNVLKYAGAHNPIWIIRNGEVLETKADKQPIGKFDKQLPYTTHTFELEKGDAIYIFSDGYVDQFGGEKGKKFKSKAFRELLLSIQEKPMEEQRVLIDETFETWRGNIEQIDDVCVIGVRI